MNDNNLLKPMRERITALDALRGAALFGVLLVNLEVGFRVSLFQKMLTPHTHAGRLNYFMDLLVAGVFEFKAFTLFSLLFGVGVGIQTQRWRHSSSRFLARRFTVLFFIGLAHMLLLWNGDILLLYAVCGWLLVPLVGLPVRWLVLIGLALILLAPFLPFFNAYFPAHEALRAQAAVATQVYAAGSFSEIMYFRYHEAGQFIAPLLLASLPRTLGLMLCGIAIERSGLPHQTLGPWLKVITGLAGALGLGLTVWSLWAKETGYVLPAALEWLSAYEVVLLAAGYGATLWHWLSRTRSNAARWLAAGGRLALSNYLLQSVIFSLFFYGFGFGWFGQLGSAITALLGCTVFVTQLIASYWWLRHYEFGPVEWIWRTLTYGRSLPLK